MRVSHLQFWLIAASLGGIAGPQLQLRAAISASAPQSPQETSMAQPVYWRNAAREDVIAAYEIFRHHHPGMFDPHNPGFPNQLRRARDGALQFAGRAYDAEGHMRALALFSAVLADGHARVQASYSGHGDVFWPGFRTAWRGDALHVLSPVDNGPAQDSVLLGCDGKDARTVIRNAAFSFYGRPAEPGQWWQAAPSTFQRVKSPYERLPHLCRFRGPEGRVRAYTLKWQPVPHDLLQAWFETGSKTEPVGLSQPRRGMYLITLTTFSPDDEGRAQYERLFRDIDRNIASIAAARAVVIDLRNNGGGSSSWGERVADHLWGEPAVKTKLSLYFRNTQVWWLADTPNVQHFHQFAAEFRAQGRSKDAAELDDVARHLSTAVNDGKRFYVEDFGASFGTGKGDVAPRQLPPVYVITDGGCASACLDALDVFTQFPRVKLVGAPTSADSNYLDIRFQPLPSDRGVVILPTKIWVGRPRRAGEVYRPDIPVNDLDWTTTTMLDHIERDLAR